MSVIEHRGSRKVIFRSEDSSLSKKQTLELAVANRADLRGADLRGADLGGANLGGAYLGWAYLGGAYLGGAYLGGADLGGAYLGGAYLGGADLGGADLGGAYLRGVDGEKATVIALQRLGSPSSQHYEYFAWLVHPEGQPDGDRYWVIVAGCRYFIGLDNARAHWDPCSHGEPWKCRWVQRRLQELDESPTYGRSDP